jgi:serine phosphatase RsbU (regulator of sigma subunit)
VERFWDPGSYDMRALSVPFAIALVALTSVIGYALLMRGAAVLRGWFLANTLSLAPYAIAVTIAASTTDPEVATWLYRFGTAFIAMAAGTGLGFHLSLVGAMSRHRVVFVCAIVLGFGWLPVMLASDAVVAGVQWLPVGMWFVEPGPLAPLMLASVIVVSAIGFVILWRIIERESQSDRRRVWTRAFVGTLVTFSGMIDVALAYGVGWFPVAWLTLTVGSALTLRTLVVDDLLRARALDLRVPRLVLYFGLTVLAGWAVISMLGRDQPWWVLTIGLMAAFLGLRVGLAVIALINRGGRRAEGPIERVLGQFTLRSTRLRDAGEIANLATDAVEVATGVRPRVIVPAREDWSWLALGGSDGGKAGVRLAEAETPDPLLLGWLSEHAGPLFRDELDLVADDDLRPSIDALFGAHDVTAIVPLASRDEVVGMLLIPGQGRRLRRRDADFLIRIAPRVAAALVHARMAQEAREREALELEIELAGVIQAGFVPPPKLQTIGDVAITGSWEPASRCGGDYWSLHELPDGRVLVTIGDVTGHGVAAAMVTAAARAACEVAVRAGPLDLGALIAQIDRAVRRAAGGRRYLTCFAAVLDPPRGEVHYVSAGHVPPYVCRVSDGKIELGALVTRGNPLGGDDAPVARVATRPLLPGDVIIWYTDGLIEGRDPNGQPFGDRRMQRLLRQLDPDRLDPAHVHGAIVAATATHRAGQRHDDDVTLVVARAGKRIAP